MLFSVGVVPGIIAPSFCGAADHSPDDLGIRNVREDLTVPSPWCDLMANACGVQFPLAMRTVMAG